MKNDYKVSKSNVKETKAVIRKEEKQAAEQKKSEVTYQNKVIRLL